MCHEAGQSADVPLSNKQTKPVFLDTQFYLSTNLEHILLSNVSVLMCRKAISQSIKALYIKKSFGSWKLAAAVLPWKLTSAASANS